MEHCEEVHRAVLHYTFVMSLNYRPFNSGVWAVDKKAMLSHFKAMLPGGHMHPYFRHYARLWAKDLKEPAASDHDFEELWDRLDELTSLCAKLENPKAMRWFSVNGCCKDNFEEYWPLKMILRYDLQGAGTDEDDGYEAASRSSFVWNNIVGIVLGC